MNEDTAVRYGLPVRVTRIPIIEQAGTTRVRNETWRMKWLVARFDQIADSR